MKIGEGRFENMIFLRIIAIMSNAIGLEASSSEFDTVLRTARGFEREAILPSRR